MKKMIRGILDDDIEMNIAKLIWFGSFLWSFTSMIRGFGFGFFSIIVCFVFSAIIGVIPAAYFMLAVGSGGDVTHYHDDDV